MELTDEIYDEIFKSPDDWLYTAEQHLISAKYLDNRLKEIILKGRDILYENEEEFMAIQKSCLFLCGISLENAIKGLIISKNPKFKSYKELKLFGWNTNHDIIKMFSTNKVLVDSDFINRIQGYLQWAGRYSLPFKKEDFNNLKKEYYTNDIDKTENLIDTIKTQIENK